MAKIRNIPSTTGETVSIACKLPNGLIMRVFDMVEASEPVLGGGHRASKMAQMRGEPVVIYGNASPYGERPQNDVLHGYAITSGVSKEFWELWLEQNKDSALVKNRIIFASDYKDTNVSVEDEAKDHLDTRSGLEALERDSRGNMTDRRIQRRIATADEQPKAS